MPGHFHQPTSVISTTFLDVGVSGICHVALTREVNRHSCYCNCLEDKASGVLIIFPASLLTFSWGGSWYSSDSSWVLNYNAYQVV